MFVRMTMIRGQIADTFLRGPNDVDRVAVPMQRVSVEIDVPPAVAKEALDLLLSAAYEFGTRPVPPPF